MKIVLNAGRKVAWLINNLRVVINSTIAQSARGHDCKLFLTYSRLNVRKPFFCERVAPIWYYLECNTVDFSSVKWFKASLLSCDL